MATGTGISGSNGGNGDGEHPQEISVEVVDVEVPREGRRRRISVRAQAQETRIRRRIANAELDRNLALLRSIVPPNSGTPPAVWSRHREPVGNPVQELANMHVMHLHRILEELLVGSEIPTEAIIEGFSRENPIVEVLRDPLQENGHLNVKITSVIRAGLLTDLLAFLEQKGLTMLEGSRIINLENALYANLYLEKCEPETPVGDCSEPRPEPRPEPQPLPVPVPESEEDEDEALKQAVIRMLRQDDGPAATSINNAN